MQIIKEGLVWKQRNNVFEGKVSLRIFLEIPIILPFGWSLPKSVLFGNQLLYLQLAWLSFKQSYQTCFLGEKKMPSYKQQLGFVASLNKTITNIPWVWSNLQESTATLAFQKYMQADPLCGERQENTHDFCSHHWIIRESCCNTQNMRELLSLEDWLKVN